LDQGTRGAAPVELPDARCPLAPALASILHQGRRHEGLDARWRLTPYGVWCPTAHTTRTVTAGRAVAPLWPCAAVAPVGIMRSQAVCARWHYAPSGIWRLPVLRPSRRRRSCWRLVVLRPLRPCARQALRRSPHVGNTFLQSCFMSASTRPKRGACRAVGDGRSGGAAEAIPQQHLSVDAFASRRSHWTVASRTDSDRPFERDGSSRARRRRRRCSH
jgi:hypothetical protein